MLVYQRVCQNGISGPKMELYYFWPWGSLKLSPFHHRPKWHGIGTSNVYRFLKIVRLRSVINLIGGLEHYFSIQLGNSQLTNSIIFQRGGSTTNQQLMFFRDSLLTSQGHISNYIVRSISPMSYINHGFFINHRYFFSSKKCFYIELVRLESINHRIHSAFCVRHPALDSELLGTFECPDFAIFDRQNYGLFAIGKWHKNRFEN